MKKPKSTSKKSSFRKIKASTNAFRAKAASTFRRKKAGKYIKKNQSKHEKEFWEQSE